jgi:nucleoside-diphosphate-sugar epimerase
MKFLITGGQGVIGQRLTKLLKSEGHSVLVADIKTGLGENELSIDVTRFEEMWQLFEENDFDCVIHMAGEVGRMVGENRPNRMIYANVSGSLNLIQLCLKYSVKLAFLSTSEVYGDLGEVTISEHLEESSFKPTNVYALSKLFAEQLIMHYSKNYGLNAIRIRPFMVYGPGEYPGHFRSAMANFVSKALKGEKIIVHRGAIRSWTFVDDFIIGVYKACTNGNFKTCEPYNIGRDDPRRMEDIAQLVIQNTHQNEDLLEIVDPPNKFMSLVKKASFDKAREKLSFEANISVEDGICRTIDWQKKFKLSK